MKTFALFECSGNARNIPSIVNRTETQWCILRTSDPSVIWKPTVRICAIVSVNQLAGGLNSDLGIDTVKGEILFVFYKMKNMGMRTAKAINAIDAKSVIPNHPAAAVKACLL